MARSKLLGGLLAAAVLLPATALSAELAPGGTFDDDNGSIFEGAIEAIAAEGITQGCNPPRNNRFCPDDNVSRGQMAVFLVRALNYADNGGGDLFVDDDGLFYENAADRLRTAGVTLGCNPPANDRYCGDRTVTRAEMAAFLVRALNLPAYTGPDRFFDDNSSIFEGAIERLAQAAITVGCNPPANNRFCPDDNVTRGEMAAFLARALGLSPIVPPPPNQSPIAWINLSFTDAFAREGETLLVNAQSNDTTAMFFGSCHPTDGCSEDPDGSIVSYAWFLDGALINTAAEFFRTVDGLPEGISTVVLRATDNSGLTDEATAFINRVFTD